MAGGMQPAWFCRRPRGSSGCGASSAFSPPSPPSPIALKAFAIPSRKLEPPGRPGGDDPPKRGGDAGIAAARDGEDGMGCNVVSESPGMGTALTGEGGWRALGSPRYLSTAFGLEGVVVPVGVSSSSASSSLSSAAPDSLDTPSEEGLASSSRTLPRTHCSTFCVVSGWYPASQSLLSLASMLASSRSLNRHANAGSCKGGKDGASLS
eukprot:1186764-Rhodomonas_salina.3